MTAPDEPATALIDAIGAGDASRVAQLLDAHPEHIRGREASGCGWLSVAVRAGHADTVRLLLERGAAPTWPEHDAPGGRALWEAARAGRRDLVQLLLAHGADPNAHVLASGNAVYAAAPFPEIRALLEAHGGRLDPYDLVWLDDDDEVLRRIAADPSSADAGCGGVYTAVVTRGKRELFQRLLDAGVRVPARPGGCRSYLLEDADMLRVLLERGGLDPDYAYDTGATLLHALCTSPDPAVVRSRGACAGILIEAGANLHARDEHGLTPLDLARREGASDLVAIFEGAGRE